MKFSQYRLSAGIHKSLDELGWRRPTDIQYKAIPSILAREDVLAIAQTGTGKTAAYAIPIIHLLETTPKHKNIRCVVMVPTRELSIQLEEVFKQLAKYSQLTILGLLGGVEQESQIAQLQRGVDILVTTPGRMFDLVSQGHVDLKRTEILVVDEADHMLEGSFLKDIQDLLRFLPRKRQTLFFSATINKEIKRLAYSLVDHAIRIQLSPKDPVSKNVSHSVVFVEMDDKRFFLERLIRENPEKKIMVFVRTKVRAERVVKAMARVDLSVNAIHGDKGQQDRIRILDDFKQGRCKVLVATDVSARGVDIAQVEYVVNYDLPEQAENYVHRIGRTGRGNQRGQALSFCSTEEKKLLEEIENYTGTAIKRGKVTHGDYEDTIDFSHEQREDWQRLLDEDID